MTTLYSQILYNIARDLENEPNVSIAATLKKHARRYSRYYDRGRLLDDLMVYFDHQVRQDVLSMRDIDRDEMVTYLFLLSNYLASYGAGYVRGSSQFY